MIFETENQLKEYADGCIEDLFIKELWYWLKNGALLDDYKVKLIIDDCRDIRR